MLTPFSIGYAQTGGVGGPHLVVLVAGGGQLTAGVFRIFVVLHVSIVKSVLVVPLKVSRIWPAAYQSAVTVKATCLNKK